MLVKASIPITSGFEDTSTTYTNAGKVTNKGVELTLHTVNLKGCSGLGDFRCLIPIIRIRSMT
jgi:hypothetical protein